MDIRNVTARVPDDTKHCVEIRWFEHELAEVLPLTVEQAFVLAAQLIERAAEASRDRLVDLIRGDCPTCQNTRMVRNDKDMLVHCPDCGQNAIDVPAAIAAIPSWKDPRS